MALDCAETVVRPYSSRAEIISNSNKRLILPTGAGLEGVLGGGAPAKSRAGAPTAAGQLPGNFFEGGGGAAGDEAAPSAGNEAYRADVSDAWQHPSAAFAVGGGDDGEFAASPIYYAVKARQYEVKERQYAGKKKQDAVKERKGRGGGSASGQRLLWVGNSNGGYAALLIPCM